MMIYGNIEDLYQKPIPSPATYILDPRGSVPLSLVQITEDNQHIKILPNLPKMPPNRPAYLLSALLLAAAAAAVGARRHASPAANATFAGEPVYLWPLPKSVSSGSRTLTVDPDLALDPQGPGGRSPAVAEAFQRYRGLVFAPWAHAARAGRARYDVTRLTVVVASANDTVRSVACLLPGCFRLNHPRRAQARVTFSPCVYVAGAGGGRELRHLRGGGRGRRFHRRRSNH